MVVRPGIAKKRLGVDKTWLLLIPEFCPWGQRQRLTVNKRTLLV